MKKYLTLLLVFVLCLSMAVPAFAAFPETADEAFKNIQIVDSLSKAGYNMWVDEANTLYFQAFDYDTWSPGEIKPIKENPEQKGYYVISGDTEITVTNLGTTDDFYIWVGATVYFKDEEGRYVSDDEKSYSLRKSGSFTATYIESSDDAGEDALVKLKKGESVTFAGKKITVEGKEAITRIRVYQDYPEEQKGWRFEWHYKVDDAQAAALIAKEKPESSAPADPANPFTDVPADAYYHDAVLWALEKGITTGTTATTFGPTATCTRGQVATFLWRAKGCPEPTTTQNPFADVKESDYFYKAVLWAYENGITTGTSASAFSPEVTCTSGQVITFLWRANGKPAAETTGTEYYAEAVAWANTKELLSGTDVAFAPENQSPRADIVTYLYRDLAE